MAWFVKTIFYYFLDALPNERYEIKSVTPVALRALTLHFLQIYKPLLLAYFSYLKIILFGAIFLYISHNVPQPKSCILTIDGICDCYKTEIIT